MQKLSPASAHKSCFSSDESKDAPEMPLYMKQRGRIEIIMGPMFAGKSTELLRRVKRHEISGKSCLNIKYIDDTRYVEGCISTHD